MKPFLWIIIFDVFGERPLLLTVFVLIDAFGEISVEHSDGIAQHLFVSCTVIIEFCLHDAPLNFVADGCILTEHVKIFVLVDREL